MKSGLSHFLDFDPAEGRQQLGSWLKELGHPDYRFQQVIREVYRRKNLLPESMTSLPNSLRQELSGRWLRKVLTLADLQVSKDGTRKYRFQLSDETAVESVWIPSNDRGTLCVSSQVGCAAACTFCATGTLGLLRNLKPSEVIAQWIHVDEDVRKAELGTVTQIVFMGMGEPLHNWGAVSTALKTLTLADGFEFSSRRVTVSTVGIAPKIPELIREFPQIRLALSLHSAIESTRSKIVPVTLRHSLEELREVLQEIKGDARRLSIEYVVLSGENDSRVEAHALARFARDFGAHVNLLPFHPFEGAPYQETDPAQIQEFAEWVREIYAGSVTIRRSRGLDIDGACGQLALK